jgi:uncharacterized protein
MFKNRPVVDAAMDDDYNKVKSLLKSGGNPNEEFIGNMTPIMFAASFGNARMVKVLIEHGANIHARNENGNAPIGFALSGNDEDKCIEVAKLLINHGASVNYKNNYDRTSLEYAEEKGKHKLISFIKEHI